MAPYSKRTYRCSWHLQTSKNRKHSSPRPGRSLQVHFFKSSCLNCFCHLLHFPGHLLLFQKRMALLRHLFCLETFGCRQLLRRDSVTSSFEFMGENWRSGTYTSSWKLRSRRWASIDRVIDYIWFCLSSDIMFIANIEPFCLPFLTHWRCYCWCWNC